MKNDAYAVLHADLIKKNRGHSLDLLARQLCSQATYVCELLSKIKSSKFELHEPELPSLNIWLPLYRNHGSYNDIHSTIYETNVITREQFDKIIEHQKANPGIEDEPPLDSWKLDKNQTIEDKIDIVEKEHLEQHLQRDQDRICENLKSPEAYFLPRVYIPCWLLYKTTPAQLLRQARLKNYESLEKLLRLDSSVIFEPKISKIVHDLRRNDPRTHHNLLEALTKPPKGVVSAQKVKVIFASYIYYISSEYEQEYTEPRIRRIFDRIAHKNGQGPIDTDLPESPEAFYKAIQRELPLWQEAKRPPKNKIFSVRVV